jgi:hypothetical protein
MKSKIVFTLAFMVLSCTVNSILAQDAALKAGYNVKSSVKCRVMPTPEGCTVVFDNAVVAPRDAASGLATGKRQYAPIILVKEYRVSASDNSVAEITNPGDMATEQAVRRTQAAVSEVVVTKTLDESAAMGVGKVSVQDLHFVINSGGVKREITCNNGECDFPTDLPNGKCTAIASWSWGITQSSGGSSSGGMSGGKASPKLCTTVFLLDIKDGCFVAINEKGLPGEKKPVKTKAATTAK